MLELVIPESSHVVGRQVLQLDLPRSALMILIGRGNDYIAPRGGTAILAGDVVVILVDRDDLSTVRLRLGVMETIEDV
jgi:cell volume regulation protein A